MKYKTILFDLDGTLLDTLSDITYSVNQAFISNGFNINLSYEESKKGIGLDVNYMLKLAIDSNDLKVSQELYQNIYNDFIKIYTLHRNTFTKPFDQVVETLKELKKTGHSIGVCSNKLDIATKDCVSNYFGNIFDFVVGSTPGKPMKPDKEYFDVFSEKYHIDKESTLYVGDMIYDIIFANNVGMDVAIYKKGYGKKEDQCKATYVLESFSDLIKIV